jgi:GT2 family glycosyltransferase
LKPPNQLAWNPGADWRALWWYGAARAAGAIRIVRGSPGPDRPLAAEPGVSLVIPSRNGRRLLEAQLPGIVRDLEPLPSEILIVDNGSEDGTAAWLGAVWPQALADVCAEPLSFARAVNRGIERARYSHICLLNNDMLLEPGFFAALLRAFGSVPDLFCATAQIRFPEGVRREETGKAVMAQRSPQDFPIRCDTPLAGEDGTWVLYGSGGCSLYDAAKLRALGGVDEAYAPAYVEDLDLGYRAWQRGWPTVYAAEALVEHRHRATTSRYYSQPELDEILEVNYLRFLARAVADPQLFQRLWNEALLRLLRGAKRGPAFRHALRAAARIALAGAEQPVRGFPGLTRLGAEESFLALTDGSVAVFPGRPASGKRSALVVGGGLPPPLALPGYDQVLVGFADQWAPPPAEILGACTEVVLVRRGAHSAFRAALRQATRKWRPRAAYLDSTLMEIYAMDCAPAQAVGVPMPVATDRRIA